MQTLMDLTKVSTSFPMQRDKMVKRVNIIELIEEQLTVANIVLLSATSESGKTMTMKEYCEENSMTSLSTFVNFTSPYGYDYENIKMNLSNQINWIVNKRELTVEELENANLTNLIFQLVRYGKINNKNFTFVIDGLENADLEMQNTVENILENIFPLQQQTFNFLITDNLNGTINKILTKKKFKFKEVSLPGMTVDETTLMFQGTSMSVENLEDVRKMTKGKPGLLRNFKRLLESGAEIDFLLTDPNTLPDFFNLEWEEIKEDFLLIRILSILTFDKRQHTITSVSKFIGEEYSKVENCILESNLVLTISGNLELYSRQFRMFLETKLEHLKSKVINESIESILQHEAYDIQIKLLPEYYLEANKHKDFLSLLDTEEHYSIIEKTQSMSQLSKLTELGYVTSKQIGEDIKSFRFSIQNSIILQNYQSKVWNSEIRTLIALNDFNKAINIANRNGLIEDRLHMLSIIAKEMSEKDLLVDGEIKNQIESLYQQLDVVNIEEKAIEIASQLIYTDVELAIELIEKSVGIKKGENAFDYAVAKVSLAAMDEENLIDNNDFEKIKEKVKNPSIKNFFEEFYLFVKNQSSLEILSAIDKFESQTDRITILANWCVMNKLVNEGYEIVRKTFEIINLTSNYSPNAGVYHKLSNQLNYIKSIENFEELYDLFESQELNIEKSGPRIEYIKMKINIIKGLNNINSIKLYEEIEKLYLYISELDELTLKSEGLSLMYSMLENLSLIEEIEQCLIIKELIKVELEECIAIIIRESANHFEELKIIINSLAPIDPKYVLDIIGNINTSLNREKSYYEFLISITELEKLSEKTDHIIFALNSIKNDNDLFSEGLLKVIKSIKTANEENVFSLYNEIFKLIPKVEEVEIKCEIYGNLWQIASSDNKYYGLKQSFKKDLTACWDSIDIGWRKIDVGFRISTMLSEVSFEAAREFIKKVEECRKELNFYDSNFSSSYVVLLRLLIKTYSALVEINADTEADYLIMRNLIESIPSYGEQAILWSEMAYIYFKKENQEQAKIIVRNHVYENIQKIEDEDARYKYHVVSIVAPSLYLWHKELTLEMIDGINYDFREIALHNISTFIFTKHSVLEPYDRQLHKGFVVKYEELLDVCKIVSLVKHDSSAMVKIIDVLESLEHRNSKLTQQQVADIRSRIEKIINLNFPMAEHIIHEGYKIVCLSYLYKTGNNKTKANDWNKLLERANAIPNTSDKIFTKIEIASNIPSKHSELLSTVIEEIEMEIQQIPMILDKVSKYEHLAKSLISRKNNKSKKYLKDAMQLTLNNENEYGDNYVEIRKNLIDLSYRINSEFAESLVSLTDDDPVRKKMKEEMDEELLILELKNEMSNEKRNHEIKGPHSKYSYASWKLLASLNANRINALSIEKSMYYLNVASKMPLSKAYPIYSWIVSNAKLKNISKKDESFVHELFRYMTVVSKFSLSLNAKSKVILNDFNDAYQREHEASVLIRVGDRDKAINYITEWFENEVDEFVVICDPYFGPNELDVVNIMYGIKTDVEYIILTSKKHQKQEHLDVALDEVYYDHWRFKISDQDPPNIKINVLGTRKTGDMPLHDRWLLTKNSGLRLGTSLNSIGLSKESEISKLSQDSANMIFNQLAGYISGSEKEHKGDRLLYNTFTV
uniref:hypothetical protein n=1 Tax=Exiguobacterium mexicanum TaxID=340146 RepID=UPI00110DB051|nr:hypothetical protein [Exiguobacterium mexicanum]